MTTALTPNLVHIRTLEERVASLERAVETAERKQKLAENAVELIVDALNSHDGDALHELEKRLATTRSPNQLTSGKDHPKLQKVEPMNTKAKIILLLASLIALSGSNANAQCVGGQCRLSSASTCSTCAPCASQTYAPQQCYSSCSYSCAGGWRPFGGLFSGLFRGRQCYSTCSPCAQTSTCSSCPRTEYAPGLCSGGSCRAPQQAAAAFDEASNGERVHDVPLDKIEAIAPCDPTKELEEQFIAEAVKARGGIAWTVRENLANWAKLNSRLCIGRGVGHYAGGSMAGEVTTGGRTPAEAVATLMSSAPHRALILQGFTCVGAGVVSAGNGYYYWTLRFGY